MSRLPRRVSQPHHFIILHRRLLSLHFPQQPVLHNPHSLYPLRLSRHACRHVASDADIQYFVQASTLPARNHQLLQLSPRGTTLPRWQHCLTQPLLGCDLFADSCGAGQGAVVTPLSRNASAEIRCGWIQDSTGDEEREDSTTQQPY